MGYFAVQSAVALPGFVMHMLCLEGAVMSTFLLVNVNERRRLRWERRR
jgi:hypothetical protein